MGFSKENPSIRRLPNNPLPGKWTAAQQMSIMGKRENIIREDLIACGRNCSVATAPKLKSTVDQVVAALRQWPQFAQEAGVDDEQAARLERAIVMQYAQ